MLITDINKDSIAKTAHNLVTSAEEIQRSSAVSVNRDDGVIQLDSGNCVSLLKSTPTMDLRSWDLAGLG